MKFVETGDGAHDPALVHGFGESGEFSVESGIAESGLAEAGGKFEKIREQAVKNGELIIERGLAIFGEGGGGGEKRGETLAASGAFENAKGLAAAERGGVHVHFEGEAGTAFGQLSSELEVGGFAGGFLFENAFDFGCGERSEIELEAARDNGGKEGVRRRSGEDQRGGGGRLFEDFEEDVGDIPAHGFRAVENENAATAHRMEISGALHGAKLADAEDGTHDGRLQANGIGDEGPNVGMRLENERNALDGGGVGAFAALGEALLEERPRIGEKSDAAAGGAFAAEIVGETFAIGGLGEHASESEFAEAARAAEKEGVGNAIGAKRAAKSGDDTFITEEFREAHGQRLPRAADCERAGVTTERMSAAICG